MAFLLMALFHKPNIRSASPSRHAEKHPHPEGLSYRANQGLPGVDRGRVPATSGCAPGSECYTRAYGSGALLSASRAQRCWSCHLPFSRQLDISLTDPALCATDVVLMGG